MDRPLNDIEGRNVIVPPGEGVSLAEIDKAYPMMAYATGHERPAALFVVRPLRRDDPEGLDGSVRYDGGISFDDLLRTVNPEANPDVWANAGSAPYWHMGVSAPSTIDGLGNARAFAPTLPGAPAADPAPAEPSLNERIAALGQMLPGYFRRGGETPSAESLPDIGRLPPIARIPRYASETLRPQYERLPPGWTSTAEMWASPEAPSDTFNRNVTENLLSAGVPTRAAEWLGPKLGDALQMLPLVGPATSAADVAYHADRGEYLPMTMAALGAVPGGKRARKAAGRAGKAVAEALGMDQASRMARADKMNMTPGFWRGELSGQAPSEYPGGAHFSRDKSTADGFARMGGLPEAREFRLDLRKAYKDYEPLTAAAYSRLVDAVAAQHPKLAADMVEQLAPGRDARWLAEFARRFPDQHVTAPGHTALTRRAIEKQAPNPIKVFRDAGYDALDSGRDVRKIAPTGIRHKDAAFDPAKWNSRNIFATIGGAAAVPGLAASESETNPSP